MTGSARGHTSALVLTRVNGYVAECERTYFTTRPSEDARKTFAAMMEARTTAFDMIRPGVPCSDIDIRVNELLSGNMAGETHELLLRLRVGQPLRDGVPVEDVPPRLDVVGPTILVFQPRFPR